jgi:hypothetical protein
MLVLLKCHRLGHVPLRCFERTLSLEARGNLTSILPKSFVCYSFHTTPDKTEGQSRRGIPRFLQEEPVKIRSL